MFELILASASPRRAEILAELGLRFRIEPAELEERWLPSESPEQAAGRLAREKAQAVAGRSDRGIVLGVDTLVELDGTLLGKPSSDEEIRRHLSRLSGRRHRVISGVCLVESHTGRVCEGLETTEVEFACLEPEELDWYVATGEGRDKAGSYALQGKARLFVRAIHGCYYNVVGLPVVRLRKLLQQLGYDLLELIDEGGRP